MSEISTLEPLQPTEKVTSIESHELVKAIPSAGVQKEMVEMLLESAKTL